MNSLREANESLSIFPQAMEPIKVFMANFFIYYYPERTARRRDILHSIQRYMDHH